MRQRRARFLPKSYAAGLRRLPWILLGIVLCAFAIAGWLSLITWSPIDSSLSHGKASGPHNALGSKGAIFAEMLLQAFGLAAPLLFVPLAAYGLHVSRGGTHPGLRTRLLFSILAVILLSSSLGLFPQPGGWPLDHGLGGAAGDMTGAQIPHASSRTSHAIAVLFSAATLFTAGIWSLAMACGVRLRALIGALRGRKGAHFAKDSHHELSEFASGRTPAQRRFTGWVQRRPERILALGGVTAKPREYWMKPVAGGAALSSSPDLVAQENAEGGKHISGSARLSGGFRLSSWTKSRPQEGSQHTSGDRAGKQEGPASSSKERIEPFFGPDRDSGQYSPEGSEGGFGPLPRGLSHPRSIVAPQSRSSLSGAPIRLLDCWGESTSLPPLDLLTQQLRPSPGPASPGDSVTVRRAAKLLDVLADYGVRGSITGIHPGPIVTLFELQPARGTKPARVSGLADDIARALGAPSVRIAIAAGRDTIGIELPNPSREPVLLHELLQSPAFEASQGALPLALGTSIGGGPVVADLARMPHLLLGGGAREGRLPALHAIVLSLLYRLPASQCNLIMIDPKMLELAAYGGIPHLVFPVIDEAEKAAAALDWAVHEMNARYERIDRLGVQNIASYNTKVAAALLRGTPSPAAIPYLVVIIDEAAELIARNSQVGNGVQHLSQVARGAGIHLIMATGRSGFGVLTDIMKANFPARIAFKAASRMESRDLIGEPGAEQLLDTGDSLFKASGGRIIRVHSPDVDGREVEAVSNYLRSQNRHRHQDSVICDNESFRHDDTLREDDATCWIRLYEKAVHLVLKDRRPSATYLQKRLGIGFESAAEIIDRMEREGIVGAPNRAGRRDILAQMQV